MVAWGSQLTQLSSLSLLMIAKTFATGRKPHHWTVFSGASSWTGQLCFPHFPLPPPAPFSARSASSSSGLLPPGHSPRLWGVPHSQPSLWLDTVMSVPTWPCRFHYHSQNNSSHAWTGYIKAAGMSRILSGRKWESSGDWGQDKQHFTFLALVPVQAGDWTAWTACTKISHSSTSYSSPAPPVRQQRWQTGD